MKDSKVTETDVQQKIIVLTSKSSNIIRMDTSFVRALTVNKIGYSLLTRTVIYPAGGLPCDQSPCKNNGTCAEEQCTCPIRYGGRTCEDKCEYAI